VTEKRNDFKPNETECNFVAYAGHVKQTQVYRAPDCALTVIYAVRTRARYVLP